MILLFDKNKRYIFTADWHLREDQPECRIDNFQKAQWDNVDFISNLQRIYKCPVIMSGDLFHYWKPSPFLLSKTIKHLPEQFYCVLGNHDLPQHNFDLVNKCGVYTLSCADKLQLLADGHFGTTPDPDFEGLLVWHQFTYLGKEPFPGCTAPGALKILKTYPKAPVIVTGDHHKTFTAKYKDRILINPGCLTRQKVSEIDHKPCVFLYDRGEIKKIDLPYEKDVISTDHLDKKDEKSERLESFVSGLNSDWKVGIVFEDNLEEFKQKNSVRTSVMHIIYKSLEI